MSKKMEGIRQRIREGANRNHLPTLTNGRQHKTRVLPPSPSSHFITALFLFAVVSMIVVLVEKQLPTPIMIENIPQNPGKFISERSYNFLVKLTDLGPRPTGSIANEVEAVKLFSDEITKIVNTAKPVHKVELDVQKISGAFPLGFLDGMSSVYRNVQNVVVRLSNAKKASKHSLLMNCHFDTVPDSPGGSDDGASCAIMLEILQVITQMDEPLQHNIILLFNGAEENLMQASHGFITKHKWAPEIRAFVNLEACGAGGREVLFQAGPNHPWLMKKYADSVPYPYASSLAQEIFQSGVIPGDTDFRIFRDFGNISGLDFAWASNGYVYHTKFDNVDQIPLGTLQRTGDNILALAVAVANGRELSAVESHAAGNLIFFDFLGAFVVRWSEVLNVAINFSTMALSVYTVYRNMQAGVKEGIARRAYAKQQALTCAIIVLLALATVATNFGIACAISALGRSMSWFARPVWVVFLYVLPTLFLPMALLAIITPWQMSVARSPWSLYQLYHDGNQLIWTGVLGVATVFGIRSGFVALLWVFFSCVGSILRSTIFKRWRDWKWMILHFSVVFLPYTQCFYLMMGAINLLLPIMGRVGAGNNGEIIVALLVSTLFSLLFTSIIPMILLVRTPKRVVSFLSALFLTAVALLILTPLGFPYSGDPLAPAPQRFMMAHAERTYHDMQGKVSHHETGFWVADLDHNSPDTVKSMIPEMAQAQLVDTCDQQLFCGLPYLLPVLSLIWKTHWIPAAAPVIPIKTTLVLDSILTLPNEVRRLTFNVTGPDHIGLMVSPVPGIELIGWSILDGAPIKSAAKFNDRPIYFVYYSCASDPITWTFWMDLKGVGRPNEPRMDIAVTGHFLHGPHKQGPLLSRFVGQFPQWTAVSAWEASYASWKY